MARYRSKKKAIARGSMDDKPLFTGASRPQVIIPDTDVYEAALGRIRWIFEEFDGNVSVSNSGGKDSTVVVELAAIVAAERGEKLHVSWLDQECEFQATVDYQRYIMNERDDIDFHWWQIPFRLYNATDHANPWLNVWGEGEEWVRPKEPNSHHSSPWDEESMKTDDLDRFKMLLSKLGVASGRRAILTGMRSEESPSRRLLMVSKPMYKWVTWCSAYGGTLGDRSTFYRFHPIFDWSYRDVWKAIDKNGWRYNTIYDVQYQYGIPVRQMRVSNYHHVQALGSLKYLQEAEPETWEAATRRLNGINTHGHVGGAHAMIHGLPYMFSDWEEYMTHLIENLVEIPEERVKFRKLFKRLCKSFPEIDTEVIAEKCAHAVVVNDFNGLTIQGFVHAQRSKAKYKKAKEAKSA